jgi:hypothetical protein
MGREGKSCPDKVVTMSKKQPASALQQIPLVGAMSRSLSFSSLALLVGMDIFAHYNGDMLPLPGFSISIAVLTGLLLIINEYYIRGTSTSKGGVPMASVIRKEFSERPAVAAYIFLACVLVAFPGYTISLFFSGLIFASKLGTK